MSLQTRSLSAMLLATLAVSGCAAPPADTGAVLRQRTTSGQRPRLVVVMSVDQLRADYMLRFADQFKYGFRRLLTEGAFLADAHYSHVPTTTGPGHSVILSGARLAETGIVNNDWVTSTGKRMYCVEDDSLKPVGIPAGMKGKGGSAGPNNMLAETFGDVLKWSFGGQSRVVGLSIKDRAAILLTGHNPDACVWFDTNVGRWITSSYYGTELPKFAQDANDKKLADRWVKQKWELGSPADTYKRSQAADVPGKANPESMGTTFPKVLSDDGEPSSQYYNRLATSPFGNALVFETALLAVEEQRLGDDEIPDLLAINFASVDYAGHSFGPNSPEQQDMVLRLDEQLGSFMDNVERLMARKNKGGGDVVFVLTADHGVAPLAEWFGQETRQDAGRLSTKPISEAADAAVRALATKESSGSLVAGFNGTALTLHGPRTLAAGVSLKDARAAAAEAIRSLPDILFVATRDEILENRLAPSDMLQMIRNGYNPERGGDIVVIPRPFFVFSSRPQGTNHSTPYNYDTHVPILISGKSVAPGWYHRRADVRDIAPTLSALVGITAPAQSSGRVLDEVLR